MILVKFSYKFEPVQYLSRYGHLMSGTKLSILNAVTQSSPHRSPDPSSFLCQCHYFLEIQRRVVRPIRFFYKTLDLKLYFNVIFEIAGCKAVRRYSGEPK